MAKKKEAQEETGKKQGTRRRKQADAEKMQEAVQDVKPLEICAVFAEGCNIDMIAKQLTGHSYMAFKVCEYSGVKYQDVRPGTILKWPMR